MTARPTRPLPVVPEPSPRHARPREHDRALAVTAAFTTVVLVTAVVMWVPQGDDAPTRAESPPYSARPPQPTGAPPKPRVPFRGVAPAPPGARPGPATSSPDQSHTPARSKRPGAVSPPRRRPVSPSPSPLPPVLPDPPQSVSPLAPQAVSGCVRETAKALLAALKGTRP